ncbi:hypothetical protein JZ751_008540 [Albula glossodonta]|uniref:PLD phosphodiesterase domain-containing protein n=1 Tax=Albula glossodonta TaxID=121402 RepID=A0A8T2N6H3_9TELE|nr:hypothetical protein JZ751_008540 [Albula glossodonta]
MMPFFVAPVNFPTSYLRVRLSSVFLGPFLGPSLRPFPGPFPGLFPGPFPGPAGVLANLGGYGQSLQCPPRSWISELITGPDTSEHLCQVTRQDSVTGPDTSEHPCQVTWQDSVTGPDTSEHLCQVTWQDSVTGPDTSEHPCQVTWQNSVTGPDISEHPCQVTWQDSVTGPDISEHPCQVTWQDSVTGPDISEHPCQVTWQNSVTGPDISEHPCQVTWQNSVTGPDISEHPCQVTWQDSVTGPDTSEHPCQVTWQDSVTGPDTSEHPCQHEATEAEPSGFLLAVENADLTITLCHGSVRLVPSNIERKTADEIPGLWIHSAAAYLKPSPELSLSLAADSHMNPDSSSFSAAQSSSCSRDGAAELSLALAFPSASDATVTSLISAVLKSPHLRLNEIYGITAPLLPTLSTPLSVIVLVENIPEDVSLGDNGTAHLPLSLGLHSLLDLATRSVEIVSPDWALTATDAEPGTNQGRRLFQRLLGLQTRKVTLKVASDWPESTELKSLSDHVCPAACFSPAAGVGGGVAVHMLTGSCYPPPPGECGGAQQPKIFSLYWQLQYKDFVPSIWSKRLTALYNKDRTLPLRFNHTKASVYVSSSPDVFCPKDRTRDIDAIFRMIQSARRFIYISITDYLPLINRSPHRYWSRIDGMLREALILRGVKVRLLISCWKQTHPLTFNFVWSLKSLCMERANCSLEVKFFSLRDQRNGTLQGVNHNKFMVTDSAVYIGNFDWVGNEFAYNAGAGLVIGQSEGLEERNATVVEQVKAVFERDWYSRHTKSLQANKVPDCGKHRASPPLLPKALTGRRDTKQSLDTALPFESKSHQDVPSEP